MNKLNIVIVVNDGEDANTVADRLRAHGATINQVSKKRMAGECNGKVHMSQLRFITGVKLIEENRTLSLY